MNKPMNEAKILADILYGGEVKAVDFKTMPGLGTDFTRDQLAKSLHDSMRRMGVIDGGKLIDKNTPH